MVGYYIAFITPLVTRHLDSRENDNDEQEEDEKLHLLVDVLNAWVESHSNPDKCDISEIFTSVYSNLVKNRLIDPKEMEHVQNWVIKLKQINYNFKCEIVSMNFEEGNSKGHNTEPLDVFGAVYMTDAYYQNIGLVHAFYSGIYRELRIYIARVSLDEATER